MRITGNAASRCCAGSPAALQGGGAEASERLPPCRAEARRLGLVHEVVPEGELEAAGAAMVETLLPNGPGAIASAKDLIDAVAHRPINRALTEDTARRIADARASTEGREGIIAFLEKRRPDWAEK